MREEELYKKWRQLARSGQGVSCGGHRLRVLSPGRLNETRGPDFVAARFELDGVVYQGDVECHRDVRDWYRHRHHLDEAFANVLLHLVAAPHPDPQTVRHRFSAEPIPTISINVAAESSLAECPLERVPSSFPDILNRMALRRLHDRVRLFQDRLEAQTAEVLFHRFLWRALGYADNSAAFERLAETLPWSRLTALAGEHGWNEETAYALYAGLAGFLPAEGDPDLWTAALRARYRRWQTVLDAAELPSGSWQWAGQRGCNHPHFRLAGGVAVLWHLGERPFSVLENLMAQRLGCAPFMQRLQTVFYRPCRSYWQRHFSLGAPQVRTGRRVYFGAARLTEILINVVLPLAMAQAARKGSEGFLAYLESCYLQLPSLPVYGALRRRFAWVKSWPAAVHPAWLQGVLELKNSYCSANDCRACPLSPT